MNDREYIHDLIRRDQKSDKLRTIKTAIQEGLARGTSDRTVSQIMEDVEARLRADGRL